MKLDIHFIFLLLLTSAEVYARAGGGGGGRGFGGRGFSSEGAIIYAIIFCIVAIPSYFYMKIRINRRKDLVKKALKIMSEIEPEWSEENLLAFAKEQFVRLQRLWGNQDLEELKKYLSFELYKNWELQIEKQISRNEYNPIYNLKIQDAFIVAVKNYINDNNDLFIVCFDAFGDDQIVRNKIMISSDRSAFREFWIFRKQSGDWKLMGVTQAEGWQKMLSGHIIFERLENSNKI